MLKKISLVIAILFTTLSLQAQSNTGGVKGTVINRADRTPVYNVSLTLTKGGEAVAKGTTDSDGNFLISNIADGVYSLVFAAENYVQTRVGVTIAEGKIKDLFTVSLSPVVTISDTGSEEDQAEFELDDDGYSDNPTVLYGQNDVFNNLSYNFSSIRFKARGYTSESQEVELAGIKLNDATTGSSPFSLWSGLNEATRTKFTVNGSEISSYGFGGYNGLTNIPVNASNVRKGWRASVMTNSALYRTRFMLTYASGVLDSGWSYAFSVSARLGGNDWIQGVYYKSFGYYFGIEKKFGKGSKIGATVLGTPGQRGVQMAATQEVYDLMGDNMYNPNWGYQNGKLRNARVRRTHEPITILKYDYEPSDKFRGTLTALYRFGMNGYSALDWYDAYDAKPDYYRNLPSYFWNENPDYNRNNMQKYLWTKDAWMADLDNIAHVNWDRFYNVNKNNRTTHGLRSKYIIEERRVDQKDFNFGGNLKWKIKSWLTLTGGFTYKWNRSDNYKKIKDLLGGDYYINIDQFAERDYASNEALIQNDLNYFFKNGSAEILYKGDRYGYSYIANIRNLTGWMNWTFKFGGFQADLAGKVERTKFWRDGKYRKGLFAGLNEDGSEIFYKGELITKYDVNGNPITSYGCSEKPEFTTWSAKGMLSYTFGGSHRLSVSGGIFTDPPKFNKAFVSPRTRNTLIPNLDKTKILSADATYSFNTNSVNFRLTGFFTTIKDQTDLMSMYDDVQNSMTNFALRGMDERHMGIEMGFKVPTFITDLSIVGALSYGEYVYTSNPRMTQTFDNTTEYIVNDEVVPYWKSHPVFLKDGNGNYVKDEKGRYVVEKFKKHYVPGTPQIAASMGLSYNWNYWFIDANVNYFDRSYLSMNPFLRTDLPTAGPDKIITPAEVEYMAAQEKFKKAWIVNLSIGKSIYIKRKYQLGFNVNVNNLLNNKGVKTGGFEQSRLVENTVSKERYYKFDNKYFYMPGLNYMVNLYFRF